MIDSAEELLRRIDLGEDSSLELKTVDFRGDRLDRPHPDALADEIAAMANTAHALLVLGVEDKTREIVGIPPEKLDAAERAVFEICQDKITPPVAFLTRRMMLPDRLGELKAILQVEIPRSLFVHRSPNGYFRRQGSSKRELPPDALARLFQQRSQSRLIRFDEQAVHQAPPEALDESLWRPYAGRLVDEPTVMLEKLSLIRADEDGRVCATVGGLLMCSQQPERWLPNARITAVCYRGMRRDANYQRDAQEITGPLPKQIRDAMHFVQRNTRLGASKAPGRVERPCYSERAVFEALVNAVAHRDYALASAKIRLFLFDDRLELYVPGALPNTLTVESMELRQSSRNELLTSLLARCPLEIDGETSLGRGRMMDKRGEGVPIIKAESEALSARPPIYRLIDGEELSLTLWGATHEGSPELDGALGEGAVHPEAGDGEADGGA